MKNVLSRSHPPESSLALLIFVRTARVFAISLLVCFAGILLAYAGIEWDSTLLTADAAPGVDRVEINVPFRNASGRADRPQIGELPDGVQVVDAPEIAPQQRGDLKLSVEVGHRAGQQTFKIPLVHRDKAGQPSDLTIVLNVPENVRIEPRRLVWRDGDPVVAREVRISLITLDGVALTDAKVVKGDFTCELKKLNDRDYVLSVTPTAAGRKARGVVKLDGLSEHGQKSSFNIYAEVR